MKKIFLPCMLLIFVLTAFAGCSIRLHFPQRPYEEAPSQADDNGQNAFEPSQKEVIDSVLSSMRHQLNADDAYTNYNFINDKVGFFFHFGKVNNENQLLLLMNTYDGGKSWSYRYNTSSVHFKEQIICAKMLNEDVGFISGEYNTDNNISSRTYITTDGGMHWKQVVLPPNDYYTEGDSDTDATYISSCEAFDLVCENGIYFLCFRRYTDSGLNRIYFKYYSTNLKTWKSEGQISGGKNNTGDNELLSKELSDILHKEYKLNEFAAFYPRHEVTRQSPVKVNVTVPEFADVVFTFSGNADNDFSTYKMMSVSANGNVLLPEYVGKTFNEIVFLEKQNIRYTLASQETSPLYKYEHIYIYRDDFCYFISGLEKGGMLTSKRISIFQYDENHKRPTHLDKNHVSIPSELQPVIYAYTDIASRHRTGGYYDIDFDNDYPEVSKECLSAIKQCVTFSASMGADSYYLSYATKDINGDGAAELFLIDRAYKIYSIFTVVDGKPVLLPINSYGAYFLSVDADGNIYLGENMYGKSWRRSELQLNTNGTLCGITYGHHDISESGYTNVYNYYCLHTAKYPYSNSSLIREQKHIISDKELEAFRASADIKISNMDTDNCGNTYHVTRDAGLTVYEIITDDYNGK